MVWLSPKLHWTELEARAEAERRLPGIVWEVMDEGVTLGRAPDDRRAVVRSVLLPDGEPP